MQRPDPDENPTAHLQAVESLAKVLQQFLDTMVEHVTNRVLNELRPQLQELIGDKRAEQALDVYQTAKVLGCSPDHVRRLARRGELSPLRMGRMVRFLAADVERYLQQHREKKGKQERR